MSVIESIRTFIRDNCPVLQEFDQMFPPTIGMEKLEENTGSYTVQIVPSEPIVKRYVNGDTIRRVSFYFASREAYEDVENIDTSEFYLLKIESLHWWLFRALLDDLGEEVRLSQIMQYRVIDTNTDGISKERKKFLEAMQRYYKISKYEEERDEEFIQALLNGEDISRFLERQEKEEC